MLFSSPFEERLFTEIFFKYGEFDSPHFFIYIGVRLFIMWCIIYVRETYNIIYIHTIANIEYATYC